MLTQKFLIDFELKIKFDYKLKILKSRSGQKVWILKTEKVVTLNKLRNTNNGAVRRRS